MTAADRGSAATGASWALPEIGAMAGGRALPSLGVARADVPDRVRYQDLCLDSRALKPGDFFVALRGGRFDGHDFLREAEAAGAMAALVDRPLAGARMPQILVEETLAAWQRWAKEHRARRAALRVLGLTGSSGKTTTKDLLTHLLTGLGPVWATQGNLNNHVGVPLTLLGLDDTHRFAVVEMGMNHPGEIAELTRLASPDVALITDIGTAHVGHLGSREAIFSAKMEILQGLPEDAPIVLPHDPWVLERARDLIGHRPVLSFGFDPTADWHPAGPVEWSLEGTRFATPLAGSVHLSLLGRGSVLSALAALAGCAALGIDPGPLLPRLESASRRNLRMEPRSIGGVLWLLDCYNASPESTRLALAFLRDVPYRGRRVLVLGELGELGEHSREIHRDLGRRAAAVDTVLFVGDQAKAAFEANREAALPSTVAAWVQGTAEAADWLRPRLREGDLVLLKGSRRISLETILDRLYPPATPAGGAR